MKLCLSCHGRDRERERAVVELRREERERLERRRLRAERRRARIEGGYALSDLSSEDTSDVEGGRADLWEHWD